MIRILIADDEKMARRRLSRLLEALGGVEIVEACRTGEEALALLHPERVDLAILDIDMPGIDGLEVAQLAAQRGVPVIFVTAHQQHAVAAFERGAVHYLLKPVEAARLEEALDRARSTRGDARPHRIALSAAGDVVLVDIDSISHALFDGNLVTVFAAGKSWLTDKSLQELTASLPASDFVRVHRRALLNLAHVERLRPLPSGGYTALLKGGGEAPVSRQAARELRKRLQI